MTEKLAKQIDVFLSQVMRFAENNHEILLGNCESDVKLTSTQEHLLMLLKNGSSTNAKMSELLKISPAAVTKALKKMQEMSLIASSRAEKDERVVFWSLTEDGLPIAEEHAHHHSKTLETYQTIVRRFSSVEQDVIERFLNELQGEIQ